MLLSIETLWAQLDSAETLLEVDAVLRVAAGHGMHPSVVLEFRAEQAERIGAGILRGILGEKS